MLNLIIKFVWYKIMAAFYIIGRIATLINPSVDDKP
jgi:hypothetical protein